MKEKELLYYLASPYTSKVPGLQYERYVKISRLAGYLIMKGYHIFAPISMSHPISKYGGIQGSWDFWGKYDKLILSKCDGIIVATLDGWKESKGVSAELKIADNIGIPVSYVNPLTGEITDEPID